MPKKPVYPKPRKRPTQTGDDAPERRVSSNAIAVEGVVTEALPNAFFRVRVAEESTILATLCGKMREKYIRVSLGDRVQVELSPYDLSRGRITYRLR